MCTWTWQDVSSSHRAPQCPAPTGPRQKPHYSILSLFYFTFTFVSTRLAGRGWQRDTGASQSHYPEQGFRGAVKRGTDNEDGLYLSAGHAQVSQSRRRWSCACLGLHSAGFLSHSALVEANKKKERKRRKWWKISAKYFRAEMPWCSFSLKAWSVRNVAQKNSSQRRQMLSDALCIKGQSVKI